MIKHLVPLALIAVLAGCAGVQQSTERRTITHYGGMSIQKPAPVSMSPPGWDDALWQVDQNDQRIARNRLDIDLLMVAAALAAASVGAPMEGAVLLALFSLSGALEHRAMGKARRAVEALMALRPDSALRRAAGTGCWDQG